MSFVPVEAQDFITDEEAAAIKEVKVREYGYRAGTLKRAPKAGFYRNERVEYSWGQHISEHAREEQFPSWMEEIAKKIEAKYGEPVNHAIVIKYSDGEKHHAPWHHDKCDELGRKTGCMEKGTGFFNISVGDPRTFQMGDEGDIVWEEKLPHCSLLAVCAEDNVRYKHCVPKDASWVGERWSLIFRTIKVSRKRKLWTPGKGKL
jgi:alkylated DNA repair dioxygenase AlkB